MSENKDGERASGYNSRIGCIRMTLLLLFIFTACSRQLSYPEAPRSGKDISIDISLLEPEIPKYYSYSFTGTKIRFFVVKVDDNVLSFFDACTKCYPQKKGFSFDSGYVVCRACNERYPVPEIEKGFGSCYPVRLPGRTEGNTYVIPAADLEKMGIKFFR